MRKLIAGLALLTSMNAFAMSGVTILYRAHGVDTFKIDKDKLLGDFSTINQSVEIAVMENDEIQNFDQQMPTTRIDNDIVMKIDGNRVRYTSAESGIDTVVPAKVSKSFTGKIRGMNITSEDVLILMKPVLEKQGLDLLRNLNIESDDVKLSFSFDTSDYNCIQNDIKDMECSSSIEMRISATEK